MRAGGSIFRRNVGQTLAVWLMLLSIASAGLTPAAQCLGQAVSSGSTACSETRACCCQARAAQKPACCCQVKEQPAAPAPVGPEPSVVIVKWLPGIVAQGEIETAPEAASPVGGRPEPAVAGPARSVQSLFCIWQD
jgi:hypothetical protein